MAIGVENAGAAANIRVEVTPMGNKPPTDSGDRCFMHHDNCYDKCKIGDKKCLKACDAALVKELKLLSDDPTKWPEPPLKGTEERHQGVPLRGA